MDDKEMLDLAAKAVGIDLDFTVRGDYPPYYINERGGHSTWNPLTDDGDALRLVVKLGMVIDTEGASSSASTPGFFMSEINEIEPYAATRRAIVRVAAEIGKLATQHNEAVTE